MEMVNKSCLVGKKKGCHVPMVEKLPGKAISTPRTYPPRGVVSFQLRLRPLKCHHILRNSPCVKKGDLPHMHIHTHNVPCEQVPHKKYPQAVLDECIWGLTE